MQQQVNSKELTSKIAKNYSKRVNETPEAIEKNIEEIESKLSNTIEQAKILNKKYSKQLKKQTKLAKKYAKNNPYKTALFSVSLLTFIAWLFKPSKR